MKNTPKYLSGGIKNKKLPRGLFAGLFGFFLLTSGVHYGLTVLFQVYDSIPVVIRVLTPVLYWIIIAVGMTLYVRIRIEVTYEEPLQKLAVATDKVAHGDFSVYVETLHTENKFDCLDAVILDFNHMVEELGSIETLKNDFISNVSHEIKTPIAIIMNNAELLRSTEQLSASQKEYADTVYMASKRLSDLVTNILRLSKLENQTILPTAECYDVCAQVAECAIAIEDILEENGIEIEAEMEDKAMIYADPTLMELVWNNLLTNAVKFSPGGKITIRENTRGKKTYISVTDTGCGMDKDTLARIFDKFYQGDTSHAVHGNGLGLALVKRVLTLHDFEISVESEKGKGSTFTVTMPKA